MRITLLIESSTECRTPFPAEADRYRRFAEELGEYTGSSLPVMLDSLRSAPEDGYILFAGSRDLSHSMGNVCSERGARFVSRMVLLDVSWQLALVELERHRPAGAVDSLRMSEWLARPSSCQGLFGLRSVAEPLAVSCASLPWLQSEHYCMLNSNHHHGLPHPLAGYLTAYGREQ